MNNVGFSINAFIRVGKNFVRFAGEQVFRLMQNVQGTGTSVT